MYYSDHLAMAETEITSSNFCCLVDTAVMLYEQEQDRECITKKKKKTTLSEKIEQNDMSFFNVFPRKPRTPVKKNPRNPNFSSSSLFLRDCKITADSEKKRNPKKPPFSFASLFAGDYKITPESEKRNPRNPNSEIVSVLEKTEQRNPRNPNSEIVSVLEKTEQRNPRNPISDIVSVLEKTEQKNPRSPISDIVSVLEETEQRNPGSPNSESSQSLYLTENKNRKRRAVQERNPSGNFKKPKIEAFSWIGRETPDWLINLMRDMNGTELCLIFERSLYKTDVNPNESRLSMPFNELIRKDFLTPIESRIITEDIHSDKKIGVGAILFDEQRVKWGVMLKRWDMKRDSGNGSWNYVLTCGWNDFVEANGLKCDDRISIWSFRLGGLLCFALVTPPSLAETSSSFERF